MTKTPILLYHQITAEYDPDDLFRLSVTPTAFERQMLYLAQHGYRCVTLGAALAQSASGSRNNKTFAITFDDGYADNFLAAYPILLRFGFTATIFMVTGFIGRTVEWPGNRPIPFLTWEQIKTMAANGFEFGAHTVSHPNLHEIPLPDARHEVETSRQSLERELNRPISHFAYPGGHQTPEIQAMVRAAGFAGACGVDIGPDTPFNAWRVQINSDDSMALFRLKASGRFERLKQFRQSSRFAHRLTQMAGQTLNRMR